MRTRTAVLAIVASLGLGLTLAYAAKPTKKAKTGQRRVQIFRDAKGRTIKAVYGKMPRPAGIPTLEQIQAKAQRDFLNLPYVGHKITPSLKATGDSLALQEKIATALNTLNYVPPDRRDQFAWVANDPNLRQRGWYGTIQSVTSVNGALLVDVFMTPMMEHMQTRRAVFTNFVIETYRYDGQHLEHVNSLIPPESLPGILIN